MDSRAAEAEMLLNMAIPVLSLISSFRKLRPRYSAGQIHLKLAGMNQDIFIRQWGAPEIDITLDTFQRFFSPDLLPPSTDSPENNPMTVWIYKKMDMFILFRKGKLVAHYKWSEFKERSKKPAAPIAPDRAMPPSFIATTLSMVA